VVLTLGRRRSRGRLGVEVLDGEVVLHGGGGPALLLPLRVDVPVRLPRTASGAQVLGCSGSGASTATRRSSLSPSSPTRLHVPLPPSWGGGTGKGKTPSG
jgi:hypothetical protein